MLQTTAAAVDTTVDTTDGCIVSRMRVEQAACAHVSLENVIHFESDLLGELMYRHAAQV